MALALAVYVVVGVIVVAAESARAPGVVLTRSMDKIHRMNPRQGLIAALDRKVPTFERFRNPRAEMAYLALRFTASQDIVGDYLEFGVFQGQTFTSAYRAGRRLDNEMRFHAFDSFEGLPAPAGIDTAGFANFAEGEYSASRKEFEQTLRKSRVAPDRVTTTEGWFSDTLTDSTRARLSLDRAAVVWIDCDLYESTVPVLRFIEPLLQDGTVLIFDDWFCFKGRADRGEQLAVSEWLAANPGVQLVDYRNFGPHGKAFIVNMR